MHLTYDYNFAMLNDKTIDRPSSISPSEWLEMWDKIATVMEGKNEKKRCPICDKEKDPGTTAE